MTLKGLFFICSLASMISPQVYSAQLTAHAVSDNELDARAESLRRLAESIQVRVSGETLVLNQFKDNKATQELVDSVKTSTDLTLLGAEVFVTKTKDGYRAEAKIDTEKSFNLYLTRIEAEKKILDSQIIFFNQQETDLARLSSANELIPKLSSHIENYLLATMLSIKPEKGEATQSSQWMADLSNKSQSLLTMNEFVNKLAASKVTEPQLAALLLVRGINQENVYTCPIMKSNGSWLNQNNRLHLEISKLLYLSAQNKEKAQYFLIGHTDKDTSSITYQLSDVYGKTLLKNQVNYLLPRPTWQKERTQKNAVLTLINYEFKDKSGKLIPENITTKKEIYSLIQQNVLNNQSLVMVDPCRPIEKLSHTAMSNAYGVSSFISMNISGSLSTFVLRPDPKEHEFALAKVTFQQTDLNEPSKMSNKNTVGKKFPVLEANNALISAVEIALKKLN